MGVTIQGSGIQYQSNFAMVDASQSLWVAVPGSVNTYGGTTAGSTEVYTKTGSIYSTGSINIVNPQTIGSFTIQTITGSINQSISPWMISGLTGAVGISGAVNQGTNPWIVLGSFAITNIGSTILTGVGSITGAITGSVIVQGFSIFEIYRFLAGSPYTTQVFSGISNSFMIDNVGSNLIYFNFNGSASAAGSSLRMNNGVSMSFDLRVGSIMVQSSGATSTEVQIISIR
jgi:hypothetical protein